MEIKNIKRINVGNIGTIDCNDYEEEMNLYENVKSLPLFKNKKPTISNLEKIANLLLKKYKIDIPIIYWSSSSYVAGISKDKKRLTTIYATSLKELFSKVVLYCYHYTRKLK